MLLKTLFIIKLLARINIYKYQSHYIFIGKLKNVNHDFICFCSKVYQNSYATFTLAENDKPIAIRPKFGSFVHTFGRQLPILPFSENNFLIGLVHYAPNFRNCQPIRRQFVSQPLKLKAIFSIYFQFPISSWTHLCKISSDFQFAGTAGAENSQTVIRKSRALRILQSFVATITRSV